MDTIHIFISFLVQFMQFSVIDIDIWLALHCSHTLFLCVCSVRPRVTTLQPASDPPRSMAARGPQKTKTATRLYGGRESGPVSQKPAHPVLSRHGDFSDARSRGPRHIARATRDADTANVVSNAKPGSVRLSTETQPGFAGTGGAELMAHESRRFPEMPALPALVRILL